ncbi:MAG: helix-turn-helix domain-containing protein [Sedimenticola sp.]
MTSSSATEQCAVIKFCVNLGHTPTQTLNMIERSNTERASRALVFKWHKRFRDGRQSIDDHPRCGRKAVSADTLSANVRKLLDEDRRSTVKDIADSVGA